MRRTNRRVEIPAHIYGHLASYVESGSLGLLQSIGHHHRTHIPCPINLIHFLLLFNCGRKATVVEDLELDSNLQPLAATQLVYQLLKLLLSQIFDTVDDLISEFFFHTFRSDAWAALIDGIKCPRGCGTAVGPLTRSSRPATNKTGQRCGAGQWEKSSATLRPIRRGGTLVGWVWWAGTAEPADLVYVIFFQCRVESTSILSHLCGEKKKRDTPDFFF